MRIGKTDIEKAQQAKFIIDKEFYKQFTYKYLAQLLGTNIKKLQATFKIVTKMNLYEYHSFVRVEKAMYLLENTELKVEAIASKVGLHRSNLNYQFKKIHRTSPSKWREEQERKGGYHYRQYG